MQPESNHVAIDIGEVENICFVVMPLDSLFQIEYERVIRPAVEHLGLVCVRGDEIYSRPQVMADIWKSIRRCRLVIAELTEKNANVFYEIGLAHAIGKPIILLTRNEEDVPFDLKGLRYRYYDTNDPFWGETLSDAIQTMIQNILDRPSINSYLEGITSNILLPAKPQVIKAGKESERSVKDISGTWKISFTANNEKHEGVVNIIQKDDNLSATMTITYLASKVMTVVQEILSGTLRDDKVSLNGTSYTFIHQGASSGYNLDNFELQLNATANAMEGLLKSADSLEAAILLRE